MSVAPSVLLLLAFPLRWFQLQHEPRKSKRGAILGLGKVGCIVGFGILQLALLLLWATTSSRPHGAFGQITLAASALGIFDAIALFMLSFAEHRRSIRPSSVISVYLLFSIAFDAVQCRTLWLLPFDKRLHTIAIVFTISIAFKFAILILESTNKKRFLLPPWNGSPPEALSGTIGHTLFWWLNSLFSKGFGGPLNLGALWPVDQDMDSERLMENLQSIWRRKKDKVKKHALATALLRSLKWRIVAVALPRLCLVGLRFSQPLLLKAIVSFIGRSESQEKRNVGYGLIGATGLIYFGLGMTNGIFNYKNVRFITMTRGALVSTIMSKILTVSATVAADKGSSTLTLMSADVERIVLGLSLFNDMWAAPLEVAIALWLLHRELGLAFLAPGLIALGSTIVIIFVVTPRVGRGAAAWNKGVGERVSLTSFILGNMKEVKLLGLTDRWSTNIQNARLLEIVLSKKFRLQSVWRLALTILTRYITPAVTFGAFIAVARSKREKLSVESTFTALSLLSLITSPLMYLFAAFPQMSMSLACAARIQTFLLEEDTQSTAAENTAAASSASQTSPRSESALVPSSASFILANPMSREVIATKSASFGIKEGGEFITQNLNLSIVKSSLTMIIGKVGSGKSTLLKGLIGELPPNSGSIGRSIAASAYCGQEPWLVNDTIQNNILGQSTLEARWYETVVTACALDQDFENFPLGGLSVVGSKGISLSGGQKARVALARAIYSKREVSIIDDILSGLDWVTEEAVWENVFGQRGLFRQQGVTVVLATHKVRHLREAETIIALGEDGTILEQGNFETLDQNKGYVQSLLVEEQAEKQDTVTGPDDSSSADKKTVPGASQAAPPVDDLHRKSGDLALYKIYIKSVGVWNCLAVLVLSALSEFCVYFPQYWIKLWAEADSKRPGDRTALFYGVYLGLSVAGEIVASFAIFYAFCIIMQASGVYLHKRLLKTIMSAPLAFFVTTDTGKTINRFSQDMALIDMELTPAAYLTVAAGMMCMGSIILIITGIKYMAAIIPFGIGFLYCLQLFYLCTSRQLRHMDLESKSPLYTHILETLQGLSTIRAFGWSNATLGAGLNLLNISQRPFYLMFCIQKWLELVLDLFVAGMAVLFVAIAVSISSVNSGSIGLALLNLLTLSGMLSQFITSWTELETSLGAIARLRDVEEETPKETQEGEDQEPPPSWPAHGRVVFDKVNASYSADSDMVLRDVSFEVEAGQKVAICGRTGGGKSSLLLTLFRLIDLRSGSIAIDSLSTSTMPRSTLRSHLNIIPQDPVIFPGSVRLNALPSQLSPSSALDAAITNALTRVTLWPLISSRGGLDADMAGIPLSQGQKQLFCLARALLKRDVSPILVLDEATSNVDHHTDQLMQEIIREEWAGKTVIAVVHKLDTVLDFDRIAVLDKGCLVELDAPHVLMARDGGVFRGLWESQR